MAVPSKVVAAEPTYKNGWHVRLADGTVKNIASDHPQVEEAAAAWMSYMDDVDGRTQP